VCASNVVAAEPLRIDGTTDQTARESFARMVQSAGSEKARELQVAVLLIVMDRVGGASEMLSRPELQSPSISLVKDRVNGMSAEELIALSRISTTKAAPYQP
jgi:hypothetical protein